jgi:hypothetical protein
VLLLQRRGPPGGGIAFCGRDPSFRETQGFRSEVHAGNSIGPIWFDPPRSTFAVSGRAHRVFSRCRRRPVLRGRLSSLRVTSLLEAFQPSVNRTRERYPECTSPEVPSPTALDRPGCLYAPEVPPSGTVRPQGFSPSRRIHHPKPCRACFIPAALMGFPRTSSPSLATTFRSKQGEGARVPSSRPSLFP